MTLLTTSCAGLKVSRVADSELWCPTEATADRPPELTADEINAAFVRDDERKRHHANLMARYKLLYNQDSILLQCWNREQEKRAGK